jgi:amidophosphoribosyltransferase
MCGIFGLATKKENEELIGLQTLLGLYGLIHRGRESAGIVTYGPRSGLNHVKGLGPVDVALPIAKVLKLPGTIAVGQVRYSTMGGSATAIDKLKFILRKLKSSIWKRNAQPFYLETLKGKRALVHNGNLTNAHKLKQELKNKDPDLEFMGESDTEVILILISYYIEYEHLSSLDAIKKAMSVMEGAYSCILLTKEGLFAFRDAKGFRPLEIGENNDYVIFSSEVSAWKNHKAEHISTVKPGEIVQVLAGSAQLIRHQVLTSDKMALCAFCWYYFMAITNPTVKECRDLYGIELFAEHPLSGIIIPMMESGLGAALGYHFGQAMSKAHKGFFDIPMPKDRNVGRSFLEPNQTDREEVNRMKYYFLFDQIKHKIRALAEQLDVLWIIVVDDSINRGTVAKVMISIIRKIIQELFPDLANKIKIAWLSSAHLYKYSCYMGLDTYDLDSLIAHRCEEMLKIKLNTEVVSDSQIIEAIRLEIGADYLGLLSLEKSLQITAQVLGVNIDDICMACVTGEYPINIDDGLTKKSCG